MKPKKNDELEKQLDATRIKHYEQTKDMTTQERVAYFNNRVQEIPKRHGLKATVAPPQLFRGKYSHKHDHKKRECQCRRSRFRFRAKRKAPLSPVIMLTECKEATIM